MSMFSKVETIGDAYMGVGGCPNENQEHPVNALEMALHMVMATGMITTPNGDNLQIRAGPVLWPSFFNLIALKYSINADLEFFGVASLN